MGISRPALSLGRTVAVAFPLLSVAGASLPVHAQSYYQPFGLRLGNVNLFPRADLTLGYNDNVFASDQNRQSDFQRTVLFGIDAVTDWAVHEIVAAGEIRNVHYLDGSVSDRTSLYGKVSGRLDITADDQADALASIRRQTTETSFGGLDPDLPLEDPSVRQDDRVEIDESILQTSYRRQVNNFNLKLSGRYQSLTYSEPIYEDLNRDVFTFLSRLTYDFSPSLGIYVQPTFSWLRYDAATGRDSARRGITVGTTFDLSTIWDGDIGVGVSHEDFESDIREDRTNLTINGRINWHPTPLTSVSGVILRRQAADTRPLESGSISSSVELNVTHALLTNLTATAKVGYAVDEYTSQTQERLTFGLSSAYRLNRYLTVTFNANRYSRGSDQAADEYTQNVFSIGIRGAL